MVRILGFHCCNLGSVPGCGTEILKVKKKQGNTTKITCCVSFFFLIKKFLLGLVPLRMFL